MYPPDQYKELRKFLEEVAEIFERYRKDEGEDEGETNRDGERKG
jgi:hypothetical protein